MKSTSLCRTVGKNAPVDKVSPRFAVIDERFDEKSMAYKLAAQQ